MSPGKSEPPLGLLLAGGASARLGRDKAPLAVPGLGKSFAENGRDLLLAAGLEVVVAARDPQRAALLLPGCTAVADGAGSGPAAGLLGFAAAFPGRAALALACDLPAVPPELLRFLAASPGDLVLPAWEDGAGEPRLEPLCALYRPPALAALARRVAAGQLDLHGLTREKALAVARMGRAEVAFFGDPEAIFRNVNRPEDLAALGGADAAVRRLPGSAKGR